MNHIQSSSSSRGDLRYLVLALVLVTIGFSMFAPRHIRLIEYAPYESPTVQADGIAR